MTNWDDAALMLRDLGREIANDPDAPKNVRYTLRDLQIAVYNLAPAFLLSEIMPFHDPILDSHRVMCSGINASGAPCKSWALRGFDRCIAHADPVARASHAVRKAEERDARRRSLYASGDPFPTGGDTS